MQVDRMAVDCGYELRNTDVVCTSLWIGTVRTEVLIEAAQPSPSQQGKEPFWKVGVNCLSHSCGNYVDFFSVLH